MSKCLRVLNLQNFDKPETNRNSAIVSVPAVPSFLLMSLPKIQLANGTGLTVSR